MPDAKVPLTLLVADDGYKVLLDSIVQRSELRAGLDRDVDSAHLLLDLPTTWALGQLDRLDSIQRARTVVVTQGFHPAYLDAIGSFHVSGVVTTLDEKTVLSSVFAAASALRTYQWRSGLTYMELRVTRLLIRGATTQEIAEMLRISVKTVNAHVSNILVKLGYENRAQYVAALLGSGGV